MKILYNHRTQGRGAEGIHIMSIVKALEEMGHEVDILSPPGVDPRLDAGSAPVDKADVTTSGIKSVWSLMSRILPNFLFEIIEIIYNLPLWFRLSQALKSSDYDLVYERYAFYMIAGSVLAKRHGLPFVLEANEVSGIDNRARPQVFSSLCSKFERVIINRSVAIFTVSSKLQQMLFDNGAMQGQVLVQPNAIRIADIHIDSEQFKKLLAKYDFNNSTVIGFAGWFDKWDRLDFMLEVFERLSRAPQSGKALKLLLIGDGEALDQFREQVRLKNLEKQVICTGAVARSEIYTWLNLIDIALLPHSNDFGSPVILFELLGLGKAVVAPDLPPIRDVADKGVLVSMFEPLDVESCCAAILPFIQNEKKRLQQGELAKSIVAKEYTWNSNAQKLLQAAQLISNVDESLKEKNKRTFRND